MKVTVAITALFIVLIASTSPAAAATYIGPGAGLSLLGAVWALLMAVFAAIAFVVAWPLRRLLLRKRAHRAESESGDEQYGSEPLSATPST